MLSVNFTGLRTLSAKNTLDLFRSQQQPMKPATAAPSVEITSKARLATIAGLIDKLMDIKSGNVDRAAMDFRQATSPQTGAEKAEAARTAFQEANANEDTARRAKIPTDIRASFDSLAAGNKWVLANKPPAK